MVIREGFSFQLMIMTLLTITLSLSCGEKKGKKKAPKPTIGVVEQAFNKAAGESKIPVRFLMAAGLLESNLSAKKSSAVYQPAENQKTQLGFSVSETAFGVPQDVLGLTGNEHAEDLSFQIEYYAKALRNFLNEKGIELNANPQKPDEKFQWIWQISEFHRNGRNYKRTARALFSREMITILNEGRTWQSESKGEILQFMKETPPINVETLDRSNKELLNYDSADGEISFASLLLHNPDTNVPNNPTHIKVIHCPMSLSACLEIQSVKRGENEDTRARLGAHYVIPQSKDIVKEPLQVNKHNKSVLITDIHGNHQIVQDAIVIMLVGNSGRYINGVRMEANPTWFTPFQLRRLGMVVRGLCKKFKDEDDAFDMDRCLKPFDTHGVMFIMQNNSESYRWGEIPDFDNTIFSAYISSKDGYPDGSATFEFPNDKRRFKASEEFKLKIKFQIDAHWVTLERAVRCPGPDQKIKWATVYNNQVRSKTEHVFSQTLYDSGPNGNGEQFYRVMVYGDNQELSGWAIDKIYIYDYEEKNRATSPTDCF